MSPTPPRRRAPGMRPEQRRQMIVLAALPLVAEHGSAVTTAQVARAAGIGEATIFRAFADKDELLDACVVEALRPDHVLEQLAAVPLDQPLTDRLVEAADAMRAHMARIGAVLGALHASGHRSRGRPGRGAPTAPSRTAPEPARTSAEPAQSASEPAPTAEGDVRSGGAPPTGREASFRETREALTELFEPDRDRLRLPPERLATLFLNLTFSTARHPAGDPEPSTAEIVDLFVHGALS
ncbi:TetR/AcrR family transcriptional regulator [Streptosporangium carneum]|uniref:TetR family transcriptional regulator n=1 Tax=Streptosporangium carneum TaxID=47481 RepID=A0A9W6I8L2_9ACTN|nr:TetR/AcrR family transcriptional regulator [Streptosporangium carneum]GLK13401.1 TetR family transcriptional regulator [Streptosporangium carneum]